MVCFLKVFEVTAEFQQGINIIGQLLKNKTLKIVQTSIIALNALLAAHGPYRVPVRTILKQMEIFSSSTNPTTKLEALNFFKECFMWVGNDHRFLSIVKRLKPQVAVSDLKLTKMLGITYGGIRTDEI